MRSTIQLKTALKEWAATIDALASGEQIFLLRKGGIRETNRHFEINHRRFILYPTHFHEATRMLKPGFQHLIQLQDNASEESVLIKAWAEIADVLSVHDAEILAAISKLHVWTDEFVSKRIAWKPRHAADLIILKTYNLAEPVRLTIQPHHKGCKSWVDIQPAIDVNDSIPALSDNEWQKHNIEVKTMLAENTQEPALT